MTSYNNRQQCKSLHARLNEHAELEISNFEGTHYFDECFPTFCVWHCERYSGYEIRLECLCKFCEVKRVYYLKRLPNTIYEKTVEVRRLVQDAIVGRKTPDAPLLIEETRLLGFQDRLRKASYALKEQVIFPALFLKQGFARTFFGSIRFVCLGITFLMILIFILAPITAHAVWGLEDVGILELHSSQSTLPQAVVLLLPILLCLFALPSRYADFNVRAGDVNVAYRRLVECGVAGEVEIQAVRDTIVDFYSDSSARLNVLRWPLLVGWGVLVFVLAEVYRMSLDNPAISEDIVDSNLSLVVLLTLVLLVAFLTVQSYKSSNDRLHMSIKFALQDLSVEAAEND